MSSHPPPTCLRLARANYLIQPYDEPVICTYDLSVFVVVVEKAQQNELRNVVAKRVERAANIDTSDDAGTDLSAAFARWTETIQRLSLENSGIALVSQIAA